MKIDPNFPHDAYLFLLKSIRQQDKTGLLEQWMGGPQGAWERTYDKIDSLPTILDPYQTPEQALRSLLWNVGWDDQFEYIDDLDTGTKRSLLARSVPLWKNKGTREGMGDLIRAVLRLRAISRDWFDIRLLLDSTNIGLGLLGRTGTDPILTGGRYSADGEYLTIMHASTLNSPALPAMYGAADDDPDLVLQAYVLLNTLYEMVTYLRPSGEHFLVTFPTLADDMAEGLGVWDLTAAAANTVSWDSANATMELLPGGIAFFEGVGSTGDGIHRVASTVTFQFGSALAADGFTIRYGESDDDGYAELELLADGTLRLANKPPGGAVGTTAGSVSLPAPSTVRSAATLLARMPDVGTLVLEAWVRGELELSRTIVGDDILFGEVRVALRNDAGASVVPVDIHESIHYGQLRHQQWCGQQPAAAPDYIATSAAVEPFVDPRGRSGVIPAPPPHLHTSWKTAASFGTWTLAGLWNVNNFSTLDDMAGALWFHTPGTGQFPYQTADPNYVGAAAARAESPAIDTSSFTDAAWTARVRVWYRPSNWMESPYAHDDVKLQYDSGSGWTDLGALPELGGSPTPGEVSRVEPDGSNPLVPTNGEWWFERVIDATAILGHASVQVGILFTPTAGPTTTDYGFGVSRVEVLIDREL